MADWNGHLPATTAALLAVLTRVTAAPHTVSEIDRVLFTACEFWASARHRGLILTTMQLHDCLLPRLRFVLSARIRPPPFCSGDKVPWLIVIRPYRCKTCAPPWKRLWPTVTSRLINCSPISPPSFLHSQVPVLVARWSRPTASMVKTEALALSPCGLRSEGHRGMIGKGADSAYLY